MVDLATEGPRVSIDSGFGLEVPLPGREEDWQSFQHWDVRPSDIIVDLPQGNLADVQVATREKFRPEQYQQYASPEWQNVLELMDVLDNEHWWSDHRVLNAVGFDNCHIPSQNEDVPMPEIDGSMSAHQRFYLASQEWITRLLEQDLNLTYLIEFPRHRQGEAGLNVIDREMAKAVDETAMLLFQTEADNDQRLIFTLNDTAYVQLDTPKKKLAALLLLRTRLSGQVGLAVATLRKAIARAGLKYDGTLGPGRMYDLLLEKEEGGSHLSEIERDWFKAQMGGRRTIDWIDELYFDPFITNTNAGEVGNTNRVREGFLVWARGQHLPEDRVVESAEAEAEAEGYNERPLIDLMNKDFAEIGSDGQCPQFRRKRESGKPAAASREARNWAAGKMNEWLSLGYSPDEIGEAVKLQRQTLKGKREYVNQGLLLSSIDIRARRKAEEALRMEITQRRERRWQLLGLTPFQKNYLIEKELARIRDGKQGELRRSLGQLQREIVDGLRGQIARSRGKARRRIRTRLQRLGIKP